MRSRLRISNSVSNCPPKIVDCSISMNLIRLHSPLPILNLINHYPIRYSLVITAITNIGIITTPSYKIKHNYRIYNPPSTQLFRITDFLSNHNKAVIDTISAALLMSIPNPIAISNLLKPPRKRKGIKKEATRKWNHPGTMPAQI